MNRAQLTDIAVKLENIGLAAQRFQGERAKTWPLLSASLCQRGPTMVKRSELAAMTARANALREELEALSDALNEATEFPVPTMWDDLGTTAFTEICIEEPNTARTVVFVRDENGVLSIGDIVDFPREAAYADTVLETLGLTELIGA